MSWGSYRAPQKPSGCVSLAHALRAAMKDRQITATQLSGMTGDGRSNISQWMHAHRSINERALKRIETAIGVSFAGVNRNARSLHHFHGVCRADLAEGVLTVTCRDTGETIYPAIATSNAQPGKVKRTRRSKEKVSSA